MSGQVAAVVAAAGLSLRMGTCKQLLPVGGRSALACCVKSLLGGGVRDIVVVVGATGDAVSVEAGRLPVRIVRNEDPEGDMASSVRAGYAVLQAETNGVIVALCDHPLVACATITRLIAAHTVEPAAILIPRHGGRNGHPTLFPAAILAELSKVGTLRDVVRRAPGRTRFIDVEDPGILLDMDTPEDYRRLCIIAQSREHAGPDR